MDKLKLAWAEFSTLGVGVALLCYAIALATKTAYLKVETRPRQLLGYLSLDFALPDNRKKKSYSFDYRGLC